MSAEWWEQYCNLRWGEYDPSGGRCLSPGGGNSTSTTSGGSYFKTIRTITTVRYTYTTYNGTAQSINPLTCPGYYSFKVPRQTIGAAVGLTPAPCNSGYECITHGLHFASGLVRVVENGEFITAPVSYNDQTYFSISRDVDGEVTYYAGSATTAPGTLFYTSEDLSTGITRLHGALLQGGDSVVGMDGPHQESCLYIDEPGVGTSGVWFSAFGSAEENYSVGSSQLRLASWGQEAALYFPDSGKTVSLFTSAGLGEVIDTTIGLTNLYLFARGFDFGEDYSVGLSSLMFHGTGVEGILPTCYGAITLPDLRMLFDEGHAAVTFVSSGREYALALADGVGDGSIAFRAFGSEWADYGVTYLLFKSSGVDVWRQYALAPSLVFVMNTNTLAISEYSIPAISVSTLNNEVYFATSTELKKESISGSENFNPYIQTGQINFSSNSAKYISNLNVDASPDSSIMITGYISQPNGDVYMFPTKDSYRDGLNQQTRVFKTSKGIRGVYWGFKLEGDGTNTFSINNITLDLQDVVLKR